MNASGEFEVKLNSLETYHSGSDGLRLGRMSIDKVFNGELQATSRGEMLSIATTIEDSSGYVAVEQVRGTLGGKTGSFAFQHFGVLNRGRGHLILEVVPDSGTGELVGLSGKMSIEIKAGKHFYEFEYELT